MAGKYKLPRVSEDDSKAKTSKSKTDLVLLGVAEHFSDDTRTLANVLVHNGRRDDLQEVGLDRVGHGSVHRSAKCMHGHQNNKNMTVPGQQGLASAGRAVQQHALWWLDTDTREQLGVDQRQLNDLAGTRVQHHWPCSQNERIVLLAHLTQLANLLAETADTGKVGITGALVEHVEHEGVDLQPRSEGVSLSLFTPVTKHRQMRPQVGDEENKGATAARERGTERVTADTLPSLLSTPTQGNTPRRRERDKQTRQTDSPPSHDTTPT